MKIFLKTLFLFMGIFFFLMSYLKGDIANADELNGKKDKNITDFFYNDVLNGNTDLSFIHGKDGVKDFFGAPISENIIKTLFYFEGNKIIEILELVYNDFIHQYYVSESGSKIYSGFFITKELETINIGDSSDKLISTFTDKYFTWTENEKINENISYYTNPVVCEIQFAIKNSIIIKIWCNFLLI